MANSPVSEGIQELSTRGLQVSPSTRRHSTHINPVTEQRIKNHSDLANVKQIPSILLEYISPLDDVVNCDSIPHDLEDSVFSVYIPKGNHIA
jgi:hypothetical protein